MQHVWPLICIEITNRSCKLKVRNTLWSAGHLVQACDIQSFR